MKAALSKIPSSGGVYKKVAFSVIVFIKSLFMGGKTGK